MYANVTMYFEPLYANWQIQNVLKMEKNKAILIINFISDFISLFYTGCPGVMCQTSGECFLR